MLFRGKTLLWLGAFVAMTLFTCFQLFALNGDIDRIRKNVAVVDQLQGLEQVGELLLVSPEDEHVERYKTHQAALARIVPEISKIILSDTHRDQSQLREQMTQVVEIRRSLETQTQTTLWGRVEGSLFLLGLGVVGLVLSSLLWGVSWRGPGRVKEDGLPLSITEMAIRSVGDGKTSPPSARGYTERVLQSLSNLLILATPEGSIQMVNDAVCEALGYQRHELLGEPFERFLVGTHSALPSLGKNLETAYLSSEGQEIPVLLSCSPVTDAQGKTDGLVIVAQDISDRVRSERRLRDLMDRLVTAQEDERQKVARDLHDGMLQMVIAGELQLTAFRRKHCQGIPEDSQKGLLDGIDRLSDAVKEGRRLINNLRPPTLDKFGLVQSLRQELEKLGRELECETGFQTGLKEAELPRAVETTVFRICQEGFNNIRKHAQPTRVEISLCSEGLQLVLSVRNDGPGFDLDTASRGVGLDTMRERAELLGGQFSLVSSPKGGTVLRAALPLESLSCGRPQFDV